MFKCMNVRTINRKLEACLNRNVESLPLKAFLLLDTVINTESRFLEAGGC